MVVQIMTAEFVQDLRSNKQTKVLCDANWIMPQILLNSYLGFVYLVSVLIYCIGYKEFLYDF